MNTVRARTGREEKWRDSFRRFSGWNTKGQRSVQRSEAEVIADWLLALRLPHYDILEIGCGNGFFGSVLIEKLQSADVSFTYHFTDLLPECLDNVKAATAALSIPAGLAFSVLDVYEIDSVLPPQSQHIIVSTGFVSPATYSEAVPKVASVLKKDGILVCDFVNHLSPLVFLSRPLYSIRKLARAMYLFAGNGSVGKRYHFGMLGVRPFFALHGLWLLQCRAIRLRRNPIICMFQKQ